MDKETQIVSTGQGSPISIQQPQAINLIQNGSDNTQIGYVDKYEQPVVILPSVPFAGMPVIGQGTTINYGFFNLFVIGAESYEESSFLVPKEKALTESTPQDIKNQLATLSSEAVEIIKTYPALFCSKNHHYTTTDPDHVAYYGYVTNVIVQDNGIKVQFTRLNRLPQQALIDLSEELCIEKAKSYTELSRTHWAIKRINIVEILERAGYKVFKL